MRTIARLADPQLKSGEIWLDGKPLHRMTAYQAARSGVQLVPEDRRIIAGLTVEENLQLAQIDAAARLVDRAASTSISRAWPSGASRRR